MVPCFTCHLSTVNGFLSRRTRLYAWRLQPLCQAFQLALLYQHLRPLQVSQPPTLSHLPRPPLQLWSHPPRLQLPNPLLNPPPNPHPPTMMTMRTATMMMMTTMTMAMTRISPGATSKCALNPLRSRFPLHLSHLIFSRPLTRNIL